LSTSEQRDYAGLATTGAADCHGEPPKPEGDRVLDPLRRLTTISAPVLPELDTRAAAEDRGEDRRWLRMVPSGAATFELAQLLGERSTSVRADAFRSFSRCEPGGLPMRTVWAAGKM
jgi:hypothetical protein